MAETVTVEERPRLGAAALVNPNPGHCRTCGAPVPHPRQYCDEHRPAPKPAKPKRSKPLQVVRGERPVTSVVSDVAKATGTAKRATVDATAKLFGKLFVYLSIFVAMALVSGDPALATEEEQERQVGELQLSEDQAKAIAHPLARLFAPTALWQKVGPSLIENSDALDAVVALYDWVSSIFRYKRQRAKREQAMAAAPTNGHVAPGPVVHAVPFTDAEAQVPYIPPEWGQQVGPSPEQLAEIRRRAEEARRAAGEQ